MVDWKIDHESILSGLLLFCHIIYLEKYKGEVKVKLIYKLIHYWGSQILGASGTYLKSKFCSDFGAATHWLCDFGFAVSSAIKRYLITQTLRIRLI